MGLVLWQYILIILGSEVVLVTLILVIIWQYCKWSTGKRYKDKRSEKPPLVNLADDDMLDDVFSNKAVVEYGQPPSNPGSFRINEFPKPLRRPQMIRHLPSVHENVDAIEMDSLPPPYASKEVTYVSLNSKSPEPSIRISLAHLNESSDCSESGVSRENDSIPIRLSVTPVDSEDDSSVTLSHTKMRTDSPLPEVESTDRAANKANGRVRFEALWLNKPNRKNKVAMV